MLDVTVTSNAPAVRGRVDLHRRRRDRRTAEGDRERRVELATVPPTWWRTTECSPSCAGAATKSSAPPVAVSNVHTPAPMLVFGLLPTVSITYGPPNTSSPSTWKWFSDLPMISVSMSVDGPGSSHVVRARNSVPSAGSSGTSRKKNRQSPDSARHVQSLAPNTEPLLYSRCACAAATSVPPNSIAPEQCRHRCPARRLPRPPPRPARSSCRRRWSARSRRSTCRRACPAGTVIEASNEPVADAGVVDPRPVGVLVPAISISKSVTGIAGLRPECWRPRKRPSAIRSLGSRTKFVSEFDPARWYMNRTYSPLSISDFFQSRSRLSSGLEIVLLILVVDHPVAAGVGPQVPVAVDVGPVVGQQPPRLVLDVVPVAVELRAWEVRPHDHQVGVRMERPPAYDRSIR